MAKKHHMCNDKCKGRSVNTVSCYLCGELFYSKCFQLDTQTQTKINSIDSCLRFICGMCQSNCNTNKRKSLGSQMNHSQSSVPLDNGNNNNINNNVNKILEILENMYKIMLKIDDKMDKLHSTSNEKDSIQIITNLIDKKLNDINASNVQKRVNGLNQSLIDNWQMQNDSINDSQNFNVGRPSILVQQSIDDDIMQILKNSERITWDTLDLLTSEIRAQSIKIDTLVNTASVHRSSSPLVEAINSVNELNDNSLSVNTNNQLESAGLSALNYLDALSSIIESNHEINDDTEIFSLDENSNEQSMNATNIPATDSNVLPTDDVIDNVNKISEFIYLSLKQT